MVVSAVVVPIARRVRQVPFMVSILPVVTQRKAKAAAITTNHHAIWAFARLTGSTPSGRRREGSRRMSVLAAKNQSEPRIKTKTKTIGQNLNFSIPTKLNRDRTSAASLVTAVGRVSVSSPALRVSVTLLGIVKVGCAIRRLNGSSMVFASPLLAATGLGFRE